jgi:hypothetical protein
MIGDGGMGPASGTDATSRGAPSIPPNATVLQPQPTDPAFPAGDGNRGPNKKLIGAVAAVLVLLIGGAIWYFGYFMNPSTIYSQSLGNTGKGYDKLVDYVDKQEKQAERGYTGSGTYKAKFGDFSTDGKVGLKGDSDNSELTFDVGLGVTRVNADIRTLKSAGDTPDIYVKVDDIKGLGTVLGVPELDANLAKIDGSWIVIDHTFTDNLTGIATAQAQSDKAKMEGPTRAQLLDEARAFGKVNQQYLFSTNKDRAVTKVVKKYGTETVDGHKTYHYAVSLQKDNVKKYILAQSDALKASKLNDWLKKNKYDKDVYDGFKDAADSTKDIDTKATYDIWMDVSHRVVYKVRLDDDGKTAADNYVDIGMDYKGGDVFPFFISGKTKSEGDTVTFKFVTTLDTKSGKTNFKLDVKSTGSDAGNLTANFDFRSASGGVKIAKPAGAKPLSQVLTELGLGDIVNQYSKSADDSKRETDIRIIQTQLEAFFAENGYYPSLADMNNPTWLAKDMKSLDQSALQDPAAKDRKLAAAPAAGVYSYQVTGSNGESCENDDTMCQRYTLTATYAEPGTGPKTYVKQNLD